MTCPAADLPALRGLSDECFHADQYRSFAALREQRPVCRGRYFDGAPVWLVSTYEGVRSVLSNRRFITDVSRSSIDVPAVFGIPPQLRPFYDRNLLGVDAPDHIRLRRLIAPALTPGRAAALRPWIQRTTEELLDEMASDEVVDLVARFAQPLAVAVVSEIMGIPPEDRDRWSGRSGAVHETGSDSPGQQGQLAEDATRMVEFARRLVGTKRGRPADDLTSTLVKACDDDDVRFDEEELVGMVVGLLGAGHRTTSRFIANGVYALLTNPEQLALLRRRPSIMPAAIEEMLRFLPPLEAASALRVATEDVSVGGVTIPAGDVVQVFFAAANRDPCPFPKPDRLLVDRVENGHVAFGHGPHFCPGASLARAEGEIAFEALLARFPNLALAVPPEQVEWHRSFSRGPVRLPVRLV